VTYLVQDVWGAAVKILGTSNDAAVYDRLNESLEVLANSGEWDLLVGFLDVCTGCDQTVVLPQEVYTILSVNIGGRPSVGRDLFYRFHLNGLGDCHCACSWTWVDQPSTPTFRELLEPSKIVATITRPEDAGAEVRVFGLDELGNTVRTVENGVLVDGYRVPTIYGVPVPDSGAPEFRWITRVYKSRTSGPVWLTSFDLGQNTGTLIGKYEPKETNPLYRRIKISHAADWVRIAYRKRILDVSQEQDLIPLPSRTALLMMLRSLKAADEGDLASSLSYESNARRYLQEAIWALRSNTIAPMDVHNAPPPLEGQPVVD
jgi:hypothetical protein